MIKWSDKMSVGYSGIDEQHKKLINIIDQVVLVIKEEDNDFNNLIEILTQLDNYVIEHFNYEEALMKRYNYPEAENHIKQHDELRTKMEEMNVFDIEKSIDFYRSLLVYLVDWLSNHIMMTDKKFGTFLSNV